MAVTLLGPMPRTDIQCRRIGRIYLHQRPRRLVRDHRNIIRHVRRIISRNFISRNFIRRKYDIRQQTVGHLVTHDITASELLFAAYAARGVAIAQHNLGLPWRESRPD